MIVGFTILLLTFFYRDGATLARELTDMLRRAIGDRAERYVEVGTRAVRASVNSMLVVACSMGSPRLCVCGAGTPRRCCGPRSPAPSLRSVLGYAAVAALALQLAFRGCRQPRLWLLWRAVLLSATSCATDGGPRRVRLPLSGC